MKPLCFTRQEWRDKYSQGAYESVFGETADLSESLFDYAFVVVDEHEQLVGGLHRRQVNGGIAKSAKLRNQPAGIRHAGEARRQVITRRRRVCMNLRSQRQSKGIHAGIMDRDREGL